MNKHKITLVVEGLAERIFVRQLLLTWFDYDPERLGYDIYSLHANQIRSTSGALTSYGSMDSEYYFQIIDACNDTQVLSAILKRIERFVESGYELVIGLKDMYGANYEAVESRRVINREVCDRFIASAEQTIADAGYEGTIHICFAIMEVEAWFLALQNVHRYIGIDNLSSVQTGSDRTIAISNPEEQFYHPSMTLTQIVEAYNKSYGKHEGNIEALLSELVKEDISALYASPMCPSFSIYMNTILPEFFEGKTDNC